MAESSTKPYLIRALHEWCTDNSYTPYIVVQVDGHTKVPTAHVYHGQITLNISHFATNQLLLGNELIEFQARFNHVIENISVPVGAISAIYAQETGAGMAFEVEAAQEEEDDAPSLLQDDAHSAETDSGTPHTNAKDQASPPQENQADSNTPSPTRPHLTIVK